MLANNLCMGWQRAEESVTIVQFIMAGIFLGIAYFLLLIFADFGSQSAAIQFGGFAVILGVIILIVRKMFPR